MGGDEAEVQGQLQQHARTANSELISFGMLVYRLCFSIIIIHFSLVLSTTWIINHEMGVDTKTLYRQLSL